MKQKLRDFISLYEKINYEKLYENILTFKLNMILYISENHISYFETCSNIVPSLKIEIPEEYFKFSDEIEELNLLHAENLIKIIKQYEEYFGEIDSHIEKRIVEDFILMI